MKGAMIRLALASIPLLLTSALTPELAWAQQEYTRWYFGEGAGVDFSSGAPEALLDGVVNATEGTATICDPATGALLFSTDGITVYNREQRPMPNGAGLKGHRSSTQSAVIIPIPCDTSLYAVFTTDAEDYDDPPNDGLHYSIVDMRLDGGRGAVTLKNVPLLDTASEKLVAIVHANRRDYWVIAHGDAGRTFYAYRVDRNGVDARPVTSMAGVDQGPPGAPFQWSPGMLKASPDGRWLAQMLYAYALPSELFAFDAATGVVSRPILLTPPDTAGFYGASFSPDSRKLYMQRGGWILQFDLSSGDPSTIQASRTTIATAPPKPGGMQLGPDGLIYIARDREPWLAAISRPNEAGMACGYIDRAVDLRGRLCLTGMPTNIDGLALGVDRACLRPRALFTIDDTVICRGGCVSLREASERAPTMWRWELEGASMESSSQRTPPQPCYETPGRHAVRLIASNDNGADTSVAYVTVLAPPVVDAGSDLFSCPGEPSLLDGRATGDAPFSFRWDPPDELSCMDCARPEVRPTTSRTYRVHVTDANGCSGIDSVRVIVDDARVARISIAGDLSARPGDTIIASLALDGALGTVESAGFSLELSFDRRMALLVGSPEQWLAATALEGWTIRSSSISDTSIILSLGRPPDGPMPRSLAGPATLLRVPFALYLGSITGFEIIPALRPDTSGCLLLQTQPSEAHVEICGATDRLVTLDSSSLALRVAPHPISDASVLSIEALRRQPVIIEVIDAAGGVRLTLHAGAGPGGIAAPIRWDLLDPGAYLLRVLGEASIATRQIIISR
jgi:PKD repeat protein